MGPWLQRFAVSVFAVLICASLSSAAGLKSAKRAYDQKDYANAFNEFRPMAEQGNTEAQFYVGKMYMMGQGVLKDEDEAIKWFRVSADKGNADAQFFLGSYYLLPHRDIAEGAKWLRLSADQGQQDAQLLLGKSYLQGDKDLPRDAVQADMWLRLAAKNNLEFYQTQLLAAEGEMTPAEIAQGKELAAAWKPKVTAAANGSNANHSVKKN